MIGWQWFCDDLKSCPTIGPSTDGQRCSKRSSHRIARQSPYQETRFPNVPRKQVNASSSSAQYWICYALYLTLCSKSSQGCILIHLLKLYFVLCYIENYFQLNYFVHSDMFLSPLLPQDIDTTASSAEP